MMIKEFIRESCKSIMWLSTMAHELICAICVAVIELTYIK